MYTIYSMRNKFKIFRKIDAFSLVEIMIAVTVIALLLVAVLKMFASLSKGALMAKFKTVATNLAQEKIEVYKNYSYDELVTGTTTDNVTIGDKVYTRSVDVSYIVESSGVMIASTTDQNIKKLNVVVRWTDGGQAKNFSLDNFFANPGVPVMTGSIEGKITKYGTSTIVDDATVTVVYPPGVYYSAISSGATVNYTLTNMENGTYTLSVSKRTYLTAYSGAITISNGSSFTGANIAITLVSVGVVAGNTYQSGGAIEEAAIVSVNDNVSVETTSASGTGYYIISDVKTGVWTLTASKSNTYGTRSDITISAGVTLTGRNITLNQTNSVGRVLGNVKDDTAANVQNVTLSCNDGVSGSTLSNSSGNYTLLNTGLGTWTVTASKNNYVSGTNAITLLNNGETLSGINFIITRVGKISGTVVDSVTSAIANINVTATDPLSGGTVLGVGTSNSSGNFTINNVAVGTNYMVEPVVGSQYNSSPSSVTGVTITQGNITSVGSFILTSVTGTISGNVYNSSGRLINTGVLITAASSSAAVSPTTTPTLNASFRSGTSIFYSALSNYSGFYSVTVMQGVTYTVYGQYVTTTNNIATTKTSTLTNISVGSTNANFTFP
ncbi:MAG: carboxypeptidase regulatory-like domain-containing protein [Candidatus Firestonebacteria bacterium]